MKKDHIPPVTMKSSRLAPNRVVPFAGWSKILAVVFGPPACTEPRPTQICGSSHEKFDTEEDSWRRAIAQIDGATKNAKPE
jgi:hypothetical protein